MIAVSLNEADTEELKIIVMDRDKESALRFLKEKVLPQIIRQEKRRLDVQGKSHL